MKQKIAQNVYGVTIKSLLWGKIMGVLPYSQSVETEIALSFKINPFPFNK